MKAQAHVLDLNFESTPEGVVNSNQDSLYSIRYEVQLSELTNVSHFVFSSGNVPNGTSRFNDTIFVFDPTQNAAQFNYQIQGEDISVDYQQMVLGKLFFYRVQLFDFQGQEVSSYIKQM